MSNSNSNSNASVLDNPLLKVSRAVAACSRCRKAKIRCDGKLPACSACERTGKAGTCSGANDEFAKGKERSYVASLEGYCEKLESQIATLQHHQKSLHAHSPGMAQESSITSNAGSLSQTHRQEVSDIDDLVGDFGFLSVNATSRDFHGVTSSTSFANLLLSVSLVESLPQPSSLSLRPRHEATPLLQYYFDTFFTQLPFFFETNFWTSVDAVYQSGGRFAKPFDHWIVRMVLAIAAASASHRHPNANYQSALSLVGDALEYAEDVLRPGSITGVQAILLLAQYSLVDPSHFRTWYLVGMAVRVTADLGLQHDPPSEVVTDTDRLEMRRRVFYSIYSLDRYVSTALGRTFSFSDASVDVALPKSSSSSSLGSPLAQQRHVFLRGIEPALHMVKIRGVLSAAYHDMYFNGRQPSPQPLPQIWALCRSIRGWFDVSSSGVPRTLSTLYRLEMLYTMTIILSPSHRYPEPCDFNKALLFDHCMNYVDLLHQSLHDANTLLGITFIDMERVYQVGRQFVNMLAQDYDLLLSSSVPTPPPLPSGSPEPPPLLSEDRITCHARAVRCLANIRYLLQYSLEKWNMGNLLELFEHFSADVQKRLTPAPVMYFNGPSTYVAEGSTALLPG